MRSIRALLIFTYICFSFTSGAVAAENELLQKGLRYYRSGEYELAASHFREAKKISPGDSEIYFYLANTYYQLNDLDGAIVNYTEGLNFSDKKGLFFYNLGNCYYLKGNYDFSAEMYAKAVSTDPNLFDSYLNAGNAFYMKGSYADTIIQWETYLEKYPETPQYENIQKAIAYLREELVKKGAGAEGEEGASQEGAESENALLLKEVLGDLEDLLGRTKNVLESSEKPVDDLSIQDIER